MLPVALALGCDWLYRTHPRQRSGLGLLTPYSLTTSVCSAAIAYRAPNAGCVSGNCIFQGNQVVGKAIQGGASSGESYAMYMYSLANPPPAWDSNNVSG